ncbi:MAG: hypothetical protein ACI92S_000654 [Planctomycetaceae bacterium]|jgi:hypothetical protein
MVVSSRWEVLDRSIEEPTSIDSSVALHHGVIMKPADCAARLCFLWPSAAAGEKPNIVYIICDDLGYGAVHCLAPETSKNPTPNADRLAQTSAPARLRAEDFRIPRRSSGALSNR